METRAEIIARYAKRPTLTPEERAEMTERRRLMWVCGNDYSKYLKLRAELTGSTGVLPPPEPQGVTMDLLAPAFGVALCLICSLILLATCPPLFFVALGVGWVIWAIKD
jgi:hypothetical protein